MQTYAPFSVLIKPRRGRLPLLVPSTSTTQEWNLQSLNLNISERLRLGTPSLADLKKFPTPPPPYNYDPESRDLESCNGTTSQLSDKWDQ